MGTSMASVLAFIHPLLSQITPHPAFAIQEVQFSIIIRSEGSEPHHWGLNAGSSFITSDVGQHFASKPQTAHL